MRTNAVIGMVYNESKTQILLVKRSDVPIWVLPGGGVDPNESSESAVIREVLEETGLHVKVIKKVAEYFPVNRLAKYTETYDCLVIKGTLLTSDETADVKFFSLDNLPKNFFFIHHAWLLDSVSNSPNLIIKNQEDVNYLNLIKYFLSHPSWVLKFLFTLFFRG